MSIVWGVAIIILAVVAGVLVRAFQLWWMYRGERLVQCPENLRPAGVFVDAARAAAHPFGRAPELHLSHCSRWPERAGCGQECLRQIEASPEDCLVRKILMQWYAGKSCVQCGKPFGEISLAAAKPAVLGADQISVEWNQIPADRLQETLAAASPICFACHMSNTLVRTHPELVVDRHRSADAPKS